MAEENLNYLQQKAKEWALKVVELHKTPVPPALQGRKNTLISAAKKIKTVIEKLMGTQQYLAPLNQLGFLPIIIGVAGISWAVAAIVKWGSEYSQFKTEVSQYNKLYNDGVASGLSVSQAANVAAGALSSKSLSWKSIAAIGIPTLLIGGISLWYFTKNRGR